MDNILLNSESILPYSKLKLKKSNTKLNFANLKKHLLPHIIEKKNKISNKFLYYNKDAIVKKILQTSLNMQINNSASISNKNSISNYKSNSQTSSKYKKNKIYNKTTQNSNKKNKKYNIKMYSDYNFNRDSLKIHKDKCQSIKFLRLNDKFLETDNSQKVIFNNVGIHYHKDNINNKINQTNNETNSKIEIEELKKKINILSEKYNSIENEKNEKNKKIEILEEKVENMMNFIKKSNILNLMDKIQNLENSVNCLKLENEKLKKEINKKNKMFFSLSNSNIHKKSIGKKKEKKEINQNYVKTNNNLNDIDIKKIKLISIDPDNF